MCVKSRRRLSALQSEAGPRCSQPPERQCELGNPGGYRADLRDACGSSDIIRPVLSAPGPLPCLGQIPPFLLGWVLIPALLTTVLFLCVAALGFPPLWGAIGCHRHPCSNSKAWTWLNHEESKIPLLRMGGARGAEGERAACGCAWEQPLWVTVTQDDNSGRDRLGFVSEEQGGNYQER